MSLRTFSLFALPLLVSAAFTFGACNGDEGDDDGADGGSSGATTSSSGGSTSSSSSGGNDGGSSSSGSSGASSGGSDGGSSSSSSSGGTSTTACTTDADCTDGDIDAIVGNCSEGLCFCQAGYHVQQSGKCGATEAPCLQPPATCSNDTDCEGDALQSSASANMQCGDLVPAVCCTPRADCKGGPMGDNLRCVLPNDAQEDPLCVNGWRTCESGKTPIFFGPE